MQFLNNFLTGTENLFKLLFINGVVIILIGLFYPLQKSDELELKISEYNYQVSKLNGEIKIINNRSKDLNKALKAGSINKSDGKIQNAGLKKNFEEITLKTVEQEYKKDQIKILKNQQLTYDRYCMVFMVVGGFFTIVGLLCWSRLTYFNFDKERSEFLERRANASASPRQRIRNIIYVFIIAIICFVTAIIIVYLKK